MRISPLALVVAFVLLGAIPADLHAQAPLRERPVRALFGNGFGSVDQVLTLTSTIGAGWDGNGLTAASGSTTPIVDPAGARASSLGQASVGLSYTLGRERLQFGASAASGATYYPILRKPLVSTKIATIGASFLIGRRTQLTAQVSVAHEPVYSLFLPFSAFPAFTDPAASSAEPQGTPLVLDQTPGLVVESHLALRSAAGLSHALSRRVALSLSYGDFYTQSLSHERDLRAQTGSAGLSVALAKGLALALGYGYVEARYGVPGDSRRSRNQNINIGLDFNRALSVSRRTTLSFGTGSSAVSDGNQSRYQLTGHVQLNRRIGRSWNAGLGYSRDVGFLETFLAPVMSDGLSAHLGGPLGRRLTFQSSLGVATGQVGLVQGSNGFASASGTAGLTMGVTRTLGLGVAYSYYRYQFDSGVELPTGLSRRMDRQSVRAYLTVWAPLFRRARRPDAPR